MLIGSTSTASTISEISMQNKLDDEIGGNKSKGTENKKKMWLTERIKGQNVFKISFIFSFFCLLAVIIFQMAKYWQISYGKTFVFVPLLICDSTKKKRANILNQIPIRILLLLLAMILTIFTKVFIYLTQCDQMWQSNRKGQASNQPLKYQWKK